jgi:hypothetical protein
MSSVNINLPILLWAISWNIPELVSDLKVSAERMALMVSNELLWILAHWWCPPWKHNSGIHTKAAYHTMNKFALDTILEIVGDEMDALDNVFKLPQSELSEESLEHKVERSDSGCLPRGSYYMVVALSCCIHSETGVSKHHCCLF